MPSILRVERCVYCLEYKEKTKEYFNVEHVIPQFMGTYENAYTLSSKQVCRECNTEFNITFENELAVDSYEGFLRIFNGNKRIGDGTRIGKERIRFYANEGIYKGLQFEYEVDNARTPRLKANFKGIGILKDEETSEYDYYTIEDLPFASETVLQKLRGKSKPIVTHNLNSEDVLTALASKGYVCISHSEMIIDENNIHEIFDGDMITNDLNIKITPLTKRLFAKTVFNYLIFKLGKEFMMNDCFGAMREYIRFGHFNNQFDFDFIAEALPGYEQEINCHIVGAKWDGDKIVGFVSWFNKFTCHFHVSIERLNGIKPKLPVSIFNNTTRKIHDCKIEMDS